MGISENSHTKIDKETQSPLLKIFKEIMTRERDDPEKRILLNEPREEKKKRHYYVSKNKADRQRSCESSNNSEHRKRGSPYKISSTEQRADFQNKARSQSMPYQTEKKDSWWFWTFAQQNCAPQSAKKSDTCSCVSCALKKIVSSEYACIGCLLVLFTISIVVAFLVVFKSVPSSPECCPCKGSATTPCTPNSKDCKCSVADSERLKRKIEMLNNKKLEGGFVGVDEFRKNNHKGYAESRGHLDVPGVSGIDFGPSFRELNSVDEPEQKLLHDIDLSNVLEDKTLNNMEGSGKLREFYKKLVQTDAKIKSLKRISESEAPYIEDDLLKSPERSRRSLKLYHSPNRYRGLRPRRFLFGKHHVNATGGIKLSGNNTRFKRFGNASEEPTGFIIEKKKLLVQYKPMGKKRIPVKKCQHAPAGTYTHEKQMMHPFYKNTQRLDILLDKFLNKNLPDIMSDPFGLDDLFKHEKLNKPCKHPKPHKNVNIVSTENDKPLDEIPKPKQKLKPVKDEKADIFKDNPNVEAADPHDTFNILTLESTTPYERQFFNHKLKMIGNENKGNPNVEATGPRDLFNILTPESTTGYERQFYNHRLNIIGKEKKKVVTPSSKDFEVLLSVSTIMNPDVNRVTKSSNEFLGLMVPMKDRIPNLRRLMQIEAGEEEENLGYEDFKEVLTDESENSHEMEKPEQRKRRDSGGETDNQTPKTQMKFKPFNPPQGVLNRNWKGAMPLYPDEINSMITNKQLDLPKPTLEIQELTEGLRTGRDLSDIEYVEDYLTGQNNNLVQQAQAYSDYGVLDGKKESRNEKESPTVHAAPNHKIKLLADANVFKADPFERLKRGRAPTVPKGDQPNEASEKDVELTWRGAQTGSSKGVSGKKIEGIRFELQPTTKARDDFENNQEIIKTVSKHIKLKARPIFHKQPKLKQTGWPHFAHSSLISPSLNLGLIYNTKPPELTTETTAAFKDIELDDEGNEVIAAMTGGNRRLLSTKFESSSDFRDNKDSTGYRGASTENNTNSIDRFFDKLNMNKLSDSALQLKSYIEGTKAKNIKIYSTPQSFIPRPGYGMSNKLTKVNIPSDQPKTPTYATNFEPEAPNSIVTINKSSVKLGDTRANENYLGKIFMSVKDPEFGLQNFNLMFDIPLLTNFKEELNLMNDNLNYPNVYNQFDIYTDSTIDPQVTETYFNYSDLYLNRSTARRFKRETEVTLSWFDKSANKITGKYPEFFQKADHRLEPTATVTTVPISFACSKSPVIAASLTDNRNISALNSTAKHHRGANYSLAAGDNMTLSNFFAVVGDFFKALEYGKMEKPRQSSGSVITDMLQTLNSNSSTESNVTTTDSAYPMYDSDMIENIGHRSRVLLSIEDGTVNITDVKLVNNTNVINVTDAATGVVGNVSNGTTSTTAAVTDSTANVTTTNKNKFKKTISQPKQDKKRKLKAIVKRNADDSNLILWNDIYDDEYGIQTDKMDGYMKGKIDDAVVDKQAVKKKDFLKRSGRWVQNKIRKFARKINPHSDAVASVHEDSTAIKERVPRSIDHDENFGLVDYTELQDKEYNRPVVKEKEGGRDEIEEDYPDVDQKSLFAALSLNMKEVCKKTAKMVQETRNVDNLSYDLKRNGARSEETRQGSIASALMQQLVRLLTDLVDYQVQQKTCTKLPPDLQIFLEWLTNSKDETEDPEKQPDDQTELLFKPPNQDDEDLMQELPDRPEDTSDFQNAAKPGERQESISTDDRSKYLDTIHSVQDLLEQFDDMPDDEKSKMTGVKGYLEKQLAFLNKQLNAYDLFAIFDKHDRKKRNIYIVQHHTTKHRPRRKLQKFFKNFGRKHTRTTAAYNDEAQVTDIMMKKKANENVQEINRNENLNQDIMKRNLKDVYYKAVAEAKKFSTAKRDPIHKKDDMTSLGTSTVKGQH